MTLRGFLATGLIAAALSLIQGPAAANPATNAGAASEWKLVWSDEFEGPKLDRKK